MTDKNKAVEFHYYKAICRSYAKKNSDLWLQDQTEHDWWSLNQPLEGGEGGVCFLFRFHQNSNVKMFRQKYSKRLFSDTLSLKLIG